MSNKKPKLKSVERNVRRVTRAQRKAPKKTAKKSDVAIKRIDGISEEEKNRIRLEEAQKSNVVILSTPEKKPVAQPQSQTAEKKTIKDPFWYIGSGILWLFDTLRGRTGELVEVKKGRVAQHEYTFYVSGDRAEVITPP